MTDYSLVEQELKRLFDFSDTEIEKYRSIVVCAVDSITSLLSEYADLNDTRIIYLCATKAYSHIELLQEDDIVSFKAGDVSFNRDTSCDGKGARLFREALENCRDLLADNGFAFKAV